jgi:Ni,Fe-hydrogenase III large subunit
MYILNDIKTLTIEEFISKVTDEVKQEGRIMAFFSHKHEENKARLFLLLANKNNKTIMPLICDVASSYPALTPTIPQVHLFEREIFETNNIFPLGHPWLKPLRQPQSNKMDFFQIMGEEEHEVAVGPVHAGIIEPGHFRFQCHGETVNHLEIVLGYQHRGIEKALLKGPNKRTIHYIETIAGDTTIGHAIAYCQNIEQLACVKISNRADIIRGILLELERMANHVGDIGALANDIGYLPTASYCGRLRGDFLNMTALICGNRFGRSSIIVGGVRFDLTDAIINKLLDDLTKAYEDVQNSVDLLLKCEHAVSRFEKTGVLDKKIAQDLGVVGVAARGSGINMDTRLQFPKGIYSTVPIKTTVQQKGDINARLRVRYTEISNSFEYIKTLLYMLRPGPILVNIGPLAINAMSLSLVEGWRGEICHVMITDEEGKIIKYKIVDPSFHNWMGLAMVMRNEDIMNFPLCNKSFNLSYCGHDL